MGTAADISAGHVADLLAAYQITWRDEKELQEALAQILTAEGLPVQREVILDPPRRGSRIDLVVARVGVEVKVAGTAETVARQLQRYATTGKLDELVLATTVARHEPPWTPWTCRKQQHRASHRVDVARGHRRTATPTSGSCPRMMSTWTVTTASR